MMMSSLFRVCEAMLGQEVLDGVPIPALMCSTYTVDIVANRLSFVVKNHLERFQCRVSGTKDRLPYYWICISDIMLRGFTFLASGVLYHICQTYCNLNSARCVYERKHPTFSRVR